MDCHTNMEDKVKRRREIVRGRVDQAEYPNHWAFDNVPWRLVADLTGSAGFRRSRNVTWEEQMKLHGDGHSYPGAQYAFKDPRFNMG